MPTSRSSEPAEPKTANADPLTGEPGAHPVGAGVGAAAAGTALGAVGSFAGPVGTAVGVLVGAVVGGLTGKGFAEGLDPTVEDAYWRDNHAQQPYAKGVGNYELFAAAYRAGYRNFREGKSFADLESEIQRDYEAEPAVGSMEYNMSTLPLHDDRVPASAAAADHPAGSMEDNLSTHPLGWENARPAARAAYERVEAAMIARRMRA